MLFLDDLPENFQDYLSDIPDGVIIFLSIFAILAVAGLAYWLYVSVKKEKKRVAQDDFVIFEGIFTRQEIDSEINRYISTSTVDTDFCLMLVDIDKFSNVISAFGQEESNRILEKLAYKFFRVIPKRVTVSKYTIDKFLFLVKSGYTRSENLEIAQTLLDIVAEPTRIIDDNEINMTASIGIAYYPLHGKTLKELFNSLEIAVYQAKKSGGNRIKIFSAEKASAENANLEYYYQIKTAINNKEFLLYYQPIIDTKNNDIYGVEALLRWNHPVHGVIPPYQFMNVIEQSGDINWVGVWGFESLIIEYFNLKKEFPNKDIHISMNMSIKQLANEELVPSFAKLLKKYHIPPAHISMEIDEFVIHEKYGPVVENIKKLKTLGFVISVDGFGLANHSLTQLSKLDIDIIKLDKEFCATDNVDYMRDKLTAILVDYAQVNNKKLVAMGIEDQKMKEYANNSGIYLLQGYYYSKPISSEELHTFITSNAWNYAAQRAKVLEVQNALTDDEAPDIDEEIPANEAINT